MKLCHTGVFGCETSANLVITMFFPALWQNNLVPERYFTFKSIDSLFKFSNTSKARYSQFVFIVFQTWETGHLFLLCQRLFWPHDSNLLSLCAGGPIAIAPSGLSIQWVRDVEALQLLPSWSWVGEQTWPHPLLTHWLPAGQSRCPWHWSKQTRTPRENSAENC